MRNQVQNSSESLVPKSMENVCRLLEQGEGWVEPSQSFAIQLKDFCERLKMFRSEMPAEVFIEKFAMVVSMVHFREFMRLVRLLGVKNPEQQRKFILVAMGSERKELFWQVCRRRLLFASRYAVLRRVFSKKRLHSLQRIRINP